MLYEKRERVALVTLNRPQYRNAQSRRLLEDLDSALARAAGDDEVRVVVLAGAGEHWSSGHDLGTAEELADREERPYPEGLVGTYLRSWQLYIDFQLRWRDLPKPTIAAVQGYCIFGGFMVASAMDLIVASEDAKFLTAHLQYFSAPWELGFRKAKEILFQSRFMDAAEAKEIGFVTSVVPRDDLETEAMSLAGRIAETDSFSLRVIKLSVNQAQDATGFRTALVNAHSNYMLLAQSGRVRKPGDTRKRLPGVARALRREGS